MLNGHNGGVKREVLAYADNRWSFDINYAFDVTGTLIFTEPTTVRRHYIADVAAGTSSPETWRPHCKSG